MLKVHPNHDPNSFPISLKRERWTHIAIGVVVFVLLASLAVRYHQPILTFFKEHTTFTTLLLPVGALGVGLALTLQYATQKKQILAAFLATLLVAYILSGFVVGFNTSHQFLQQHVAKMALAFAVGFSGCLILNSKKDFIEKNGVYSPLYGFDEVVTEEEPRDVLCRAEDAEEAKLEIDPQVFAEQEKRLKVTFAEGQFVCITNHFGAFYCKAYYCKINKLERQQGNITAIECEKFFRSIAYFSNKRPLFDDKGNQTGDHLILLHTILEPNHFPGRAALALLGYPLRMVGGIIYNALRIVPLILFIIFRTVYDLVVKKESRSLDFIGKRLYLMHKVVGDSLRNIVRNALGGVAAIFASFALIIEPLLRKNGEPKLMQNVISKIEHWINGVPLRNSFWSCGGGQRDFKWEGISSWDDENLDNLGEHGFWLMGCCSPMDTARIDKNGKIHEVKYLGGINHYSVVHNDPFGRNTYVSFTLRG